MSRGESGALLGRAVRPHGLQEFHTVQLGHVIIGNHKMDRTLDNHLERFLPILGHRDVAYAEFGESGADQHPAGLLIVGDHDFQERGLRH